MSVEHFPVEEFLPGRAVTEDLKRYQWLTNHVPFVMNVIYRVPFFYYRKYLRECLRSGSDLSSLKLGIERTKPRTVVCVSHRAAFWISNLKRRSGLDFKLWGLLGEYGNTVGFKYIFWDQMDGFLSPLDRSELTTLSQRNCNFARLPCQHENRLNSSCGARRPELRSAGVRLLGAGTDLAARSRAFGGTRSTEAPCGVWR